MPVECFLGPALWDEQWGWQALRLPPLPDRSTCSNSMDPSVGSGVLHRGWKPDWSMRALLQVWPLFFKVQRYYCDQLNAHLFKGKHYIMALATKAFSPSREYQSVITREERHSGGFHTGKVWGLLGPRIPGLDLSCILDPMGIWWRPWTPSWNSVFKFVQKKPMYKNTYIKTLLKRLYGVIIYLLLCWHFSGDSFKAVMCINDISKDLQQL